jgi:ADP-dependent NAD(P)H-hydrate dehydratase / NAD(P)H-hydrate epimerase
LTVSFIGRKIGCWLADGPDFCGERVFDDLGISTSALNSEAPFCKMMDHANIRLPLARLANSYKNQFGHVLVVGGGPGMPGAVRLTAMAALRVGAGLVSVCVHPDNYAAIASSDVEIMPGVWHDLPAMLERASVIVVGPGLGQSPATADLLPLLAMGNRPMLVDADALRAEFLDAVQSDICVITPHPGEAARLLQCTSAQIQQDRLQAIDDLTQRWKAACVLKGSGSLVGQHQHQLSLCQYGHAGMATAGSGDVLSGLIAGYLAQGLSAIEAARSGVYVHALSAQDYAEDQAPECLIASDLIARIGRVSKQIRERQGCLS